MEYSFKGKETETKTKTVENDLLIMPGKSYLNCGGITTKSIRVE